MARSASFRNPSRWPKWPPSIGPGLAKSALAGKVDGKVVDLSHRIDADAQLAIVTDKSPEGLEVLRHSTAHLLAYAVKELFPEAQVTIGPVIENGFFYDFSYKRPFTPEDLAAIEARMTELARKDEPVQRRVLPRDEAVAYFKGMGEHYKAEIIASIPADEDVSLYREGAFEDLCRGPHVPSTGKLKHFKLMKVAGAYWRGDHRNEMLQRIYGTAWATKDELQQYLHDARRGREARPPPAGPRARPVPPRRARARHWCSGTPRAGRSGSRWSSTCARSTATTATRRSRARRSWTRRCGRRPGHWDKYRDNMFTTESEKRDYALKPMNCPGHILIFKQGIKSYRDLPLRYGEFGQCHRNEPTRRAARHHARARLHAGRRPHLLHRGPDPRRVRGLHGAAAEGLRATSASPTSSTRWRRGPSARIGSDDACGTRPSRR